MEVRKLQPVNHSDPGEFWFKVLAASYPDQFTALSLPGISPSPDTTTEDEKLMAEQNHSTASGLFIHKRIPVRGLFKEMLRRVTREHGISLERGVDVGSGATGEMVNEWLPIPSNSRKDWIETDINPGAVTQNLRMHRGSRVKVASMYDLTGSLDFEPGSQPLVTGLSSLDAPSDLEAALDSIKRALKKDGFLLHIQDVRPGVHMSHDQLIHEGETAPFIIGTAIPPQGLLPHQINPHVYRRANETWVSSIELHRRRLDRALKDVGGFEILQSTWMLMAEPIADSSSYVYVMNMRGPISPDQAGGFPTSMAYATVTIARKTA